MCLIARLFNGEIRTEHYDVCPLQNLFHWNLNSPTHFNRSSAVLKGFMEMYTGYTKTGYVGEAC